MLPTWSIAMKTDTQELRDIFATLDVAGTVLASPAQETGDRTMQLERLLMLAAGERQRVGELLQAAERITAEQLQQALDEQRRGERKLGDILVEGKLLTPDERDTLLEFQRRQTGTGPPADKLYLGRILVATGQITQHQLAAGLNWQTEHGGRLGEALVATGQATPAQVTHGLTLQRKLIVAALVAALSLASAPAVREAHAAQKSASLQVSATVIASAKLQMDHQQAELSVTSADIARGYIDVPAGSRFSVATNSRTGYFVDFHPRVGVFSAVQIEGLGNSVQIGADGGTVAQGAEISPNTPHELSYRFYLRPALDPGNYEWPLLLAVRAR
jgi:hypothetical protein